jgi:hypothetical protein
MKIEARSSCVDHGMKIEARSQLDLRKLGLDLTLFIAAVENIRADCFSFISQEEPSKGATLLVSGSLAFV